MCGNCVVTKSASVNDTDYDALYEKGLFYKQLPIDDLRVTVKDDEEEESGGEEFLPDELILASILGSIFLKQGEPLSNEMLGMIESRGINHFDDAVAAVQTRFGRIVEASGKEDDILSTIRSVVREGAGMSGSKSTLDNTFRIKEILKEMKDNTKYFTNNYFNNVVVPDLQKIIQNAIADGQTEVRVYQAIQKAMSDRLKSVPYWRVVSNAAASRGYHYGAVKAGLLTGRQGYKIVAVLDKKTSKICRRMNGKEFWLADAEVQVTRAALAEGDDIKIISPWLKLEDIEDKSADQLKEMGFIIPPFHGNCRSTIKYI